MPGESVLISGFSDEVAPDKTMEQQFSVMAALGLRYVSMRFVDCGNGIKNVLQLEKREQKILKGRLADFGLRVSSIGSPIGKVKIADVDDGTRNRFVPFDQYLRDDVARAIEAARELDSKLIRGFSFYHPRGSDLEKWIGQSIDQLGQIAALCDENGLTFGVEVEANLIGQTGQILQRIHKQVNSRALLLIFDGGNLVTQGFSEKQIMEQFIDMLPGLGWMHIKDHVSDERPTTASEYVDEEVLNQFVPADRGATGHVLIFNELKRHLTEIGKRLHDREIDGFFVDLEPHLRGGGQFGGYSGADGMGIALRALCRLLESAKIEFELRSWPTTGLS